MNRVSMDLMSRFAIALAFFLVLLPLGVMAAGPNLNQQLFDAARKGDLEQVKSLRSKGADVRAKDNEGGTVLMAAALGSGNLDVVKLLIDKGADVNTKANNGLTASRIAGEKRNDKIVELLKAHGAKE